jgi:hypothetical protein
VESSPFLRIGIDKRPCGYLSSITSATVQPSEFVSQSEFLCLGGDSRKLHPKTLPISHDAHDAIDSFRLACPSIILNSPVFANRGESENWVESAPIAPVLSFARTWSKELAAAVVFLGSGDSGDIAGINLRQCYCSFAYSALASLRMGMSRSASFHSARKS